VIVYFIAVVSSSFLSYLCFRRYYLAVVVVMKRVRFSRNVIVYEVDNYDRTSPWEIIARDRERSKCHIKMTEKLLSPILTESHRDIIRLKRVSVNLFVISC